MTERRACVWRAFAGLTGLLVVLASCAPEPYEARAPTGFATEITPLPEDKFRGPYQPTLTRRPSGENPWAKPNVPSEVWICYGRPFNTQADVRRAAREYCPAPRYSLTLDGQTSFWNRCSLLQPHLARFRCEAK